MSEAPDLIVPEAAAPASADAVIEPAAAAPAAAAELTTPEPKVGEGEAAAAAGQGADTGTAPEGATSKVEGAEGKDEPVKAEDAPQGAPESYADFTMPEGITLDPEMGTELTALAKELNLPQATAQKLVDIGVKQAQGFAAALKTSVETAKTQWADAVRSDAEIGGANLGPNMAVAKKALVAFGTPELTGLLNQTGLSQNPEFLRLLFRVGSAISEDTLVGGEGGGGGGGKPAIRDHAKRMYPAMK